MDRIAAVQVYRRRVLVNAGGIAGPIAHAIGRHEHAAGASRGAGVEIQQYGRTRGDPNIGQATPSCTEGRSTARIVLNDEGGPIGAAPADVLVGKGSLECAHVERITEPTTAILTARAVGKREQIAVNHWSAIDAVAIERPAEAVRIEIRVRGKDTALHNLHGEILSRIG